MLKLTCDCGRGEIKYEKVSTGPVYRYSCTGCHRYYNFDVKKLESTVLTTYPHLVKTLKIMFDDNDFDQKPESDWMWPDNVLELEALAEKFLDHEKAIVSAGECEEMVALVERYEAWKLDEFLNYVFDGELTKDFCGT